MVICPGLVGSLLTEGDVPGAREPRLANWRPLSGRFSRSRWLMVVPTAGEVSTRSGSAVTVICSLTAACLSEKLTVRSVATMISTLRVVTEVNPLRSAVTLYVPTGIDGKRGDAVPAVGAGDDAAAESGRAVRGRDGPAGKRSAAFIGHAAAERACAGLREQERGNEERKND